VYLAERADGELTQRVAVKLLGFGALDPDRRERFLQERQILASLSHPNIARLFDAGHLDDGQPFLAMEYIEGRNIEEFSATLTLRQKIVVFLKVCSAVGYLHRNLIVHRDIKPNNILVAADGEPKLLDFGISKILDLTTNSTHTEMRMATPAYSPPEQIIGGSVTIAIDIYSLGAVLYQLLTGKTPHDFKDVTAEDLPQAILNRQPARPSSLAPELRGDLDVILTKTLRKEPDQRYTSADELAGDLTAYLESRSISARRGEWAYHAGKFCGRHWKSVAATVVAFVGLTIGLAVAIRERDLAERRFRDVQHITGELFNVEQDINSLPGATAARERIVRTSLEYLERLSLDAGNNLDLKTEIAEGYRKVADVQGAFRSTNLGHPDEARVSLRKAETLYRDICKARPNSPHPLKGLIETVDLQRRMASIYKDQRELLSKTAELQYLLDEYEPHATNDTAGFAFLAAVYDSVSLGMIDLDRLEQALVFAGRSVEYRRRVVRQDRSVAARGNLSNSLATYSRTCRLNGDLEKSLILSRESTALLEQMVADDPGNYKTRLNLAKAYESLGSTLGAANSPSLGRTTEAIRYYERSLSLGREVMTADPKEATIRYNHALAAWRLGDAARQRDPQRALDAYDEAISLLRKTTAKSFSRDVPLIIVLAESTFPLRSLRREQEARRRLQEARRGAEDYSTVAWPASALCNDAISRAEAAWALASGHALEAIALHRAWLQLTETGKPTIAEQANKDLSSAYLLARRYRLLAEACKAAGQDEMAADAITRRRRLAESWKNRLRGNQFVEEVLLR